MTTSKPEVPRGLFGTEAIICCTHIQCGECGRVYNEGIEPGEDDTGDEEGAPVKYSVWGTRVIAECCIAEFEMTVLYHMPDIMAWYPGMLDRRQESLNQDRTTYREVLKSHVLSLN